MKIGNLVREKIPLLLDSNARAMNYTAYTVHIPSIDPARKHSHLHQSTLFRHF